MNTTPRNGLSHPLVAAYLNDLERALSSADQQERIDTITAVREHLTDALAVDDAQGGNTEATTEQVRAALDELGSVEQIASAATPASATVALAPPAEQKQEGGWAAPALLATSIVSLVLPIFGALLAIGCLVTAVVLLRGDAPRRGMLQATVAVSIVTLLITAVLLAGTLFFNIATSTTSEGPVISSNAAPAPSAFAPTPSQP